MTILLAGGGTAGHIEPALNLADVLRRNNPVEDILLLGSARGLESKLVPERGYELAMVDAAPLPRKINGDLFRLPGRMRAAKRQVHELITTRNIDVVVGFGGYVSIPAYLGARGRVPIVIHEANAKAGIANRLGARFTPYRATATANSLPESQVLGIPLRENIASLNRSELRMQARHHWGLRQDRPCLLVFGGSQGARHINTALGELVPEIIAAGGQVLHSVGMNNEDQIVPVTHEQSNYYVPLSYIDRMDLAYAAADFAICRAGAMTCAELAAVGLPACFVPYFVGNGEQELNARPLVTAGGSVMLADKDLSSEAVSGILETTLFDEVNLAKMSHTMYEHGVRDAGQRLAELVYQARDAAEIAKV